SLVDGVASLSLSTLGVGSHSIAASYAGDASNSASTSNAVVHNVYAGVKIDLTSSPNPSNAGSAVTLTATVTGNNPTGSVVFKDGAFTLVTANLANGVATASVTSLDA